MWILSMLKNGAADFIDVNDFMSHGHMNFFGN